MRQAISIMYFTLIEAIRARFFIAVFLFGIFSIAASSFLGSVPWGDVDTVILSMGWGAVKVVAYALAMLYTALSIYGDRDRRTLFMLLAKPITRTEYIVGKMAAFAILLALSVAIMSLCLAANVALFGGKDHTVMEFVWPAVWITAKAVSLMCYALAFALLSSPITVLFGTTCIYAVGSSLSTAYTFSARSGGTIADIVEFVYFLFPNYGVFDLTARVSHRMALPDAWDILAMCGYFVGYGLIVLAVTAILFDRKDIE